MTRGKYYPPQHKPRYSRDVEIAKFWSRVSKGSGCWNWIGGTLNKRTDPRGKMSWRGRATLAYRISWELEHGAPPPADMHVCHTCDNGLCVRPSHLFLGRDLENVRDMWAKGRAVLPPHPIGMEHPRVRHDDSFVRSARETVAANGLASLAALAEQIGVSRGTLHSWVTGQTRTTAGGPLIH